MSEPSPEVVAAARAFLASPSSGTYEGWLHAWFTLVEAADKSDLARVASLVVAYADRLERLEAVAAAARKDHYPFTLTDAEELELYRNAPIELVDAYEAEPVACACEEPDCATLAALAALDPTPEAGGEPA